MARPTLDQLFQYSVGGVPALTIALISMSFVSIATLLGSLILEEDEAAPSMGSEPAAGVAAALDAVPQSIEAGLGQVAESVSESMSSMVPTVGGGGRRSKRGRRSGPARAKTRRLLRRK